MKKATNDDQGKIFDPVFLSISTKKCPELYFIVFKEENLYFSDFQFKIKAVQLSSKFHHKNQLQPITIYIYYPIPIWFHKKIYPKKNYQRIILQRKNLTQNIYHEKIYLVK